jgi:hypothetical protein
MEPKHRHTPSAEAIAEEEQTSGAGPAARLAGRLFRPLRRLKRLPFWAYLVVLGPGVVSAAAGNDAGGIATYAQTGATYG